MKTGLMSALMSSLKISHPCLSILTLILMTIALMFSYVMHALKLSLPYMMIIIVLMIV